VGFDPVSQSHTIGDEARRIGLNGKTTVFNFKPVLGQGDKEFASNKKYWYWVRQQQVQNGSLEPPRESDLIE
jgi:hypothetical protein